MDMKIPVPEVNVHHRPIPEVDIRPVPEVNVYHRPVPEVNVYHRPVPDVNPKEYGLAKKMNMLHHNDRKSGNTGWVKSRERIHRKYRSVIRRDLSSLSHSEDLEDYIKPTMFHITKNWADCGAWKAKVY